MLEQRALQSICANRREIKTEAKYIEMLMRVQCKSRWSDQDNEAFIIPSKWLNSWKEHVDSDKTQGLSEKLGPISCKEIILDTEEYYHSLDRESQFDSILKDTAEEEKDYYIASKELWQSLHNTYGGEEAIRYRLSSSTNHKCLDLKFSKVDSNTNYR